jgi:hypothetical protein
MRIRNIIITVLTIFAIQFVSSYNTLSYSDTRVVVVGEDSDRNSINRNSEIFRRVISQLQESLNRGGYQVIDEDMLSVKLGFSFNSNRPKTELIETLMVANDTQDATVQSRLAVVFAIFPQIKELSMTKKLEIRLRGDIYDLANLSPLATFEYETNKAIVIPRSNNLCDSLCVEELVGKESRVIARELGDVLVKKLDIAKQKVGDEDGNLMSTYNLTVIRLSTSEALKFKRAIENFEEVDELITISTESSQRKLSLVTSADLGAIEEIILIALMDAGVDIDNVLVNMSGSNIEVENLN